MTSRVEQFVVIVNTKHKNVKFTFEIEYNLILTLICVNVVKIDTGYKTNICLNYIVMCVMLLKQTLVIKPVSVLTTL